jgi:hypothetical protein
MFQTFGIFPLCLPDASGGSMSSRARWGEGRGKTTVNLDYQFHKHLTSSSRLATEESAVGSMGGAVFKTYNSSKPRKVGVSNGFTSRESGSYHCWRYQL